MNLKIKSSGQGSTPLGGGGGDEGVKWTLDGDDAGKPTSIALG
jgi:hypothetical protein